ncbi:MAG TPA: hydroxymethylbilane synthase [Micavibrio sp.]|nr:hydroxymethylbilane synthase [Micavibrio sp.]
MKTPALKIGTRGSPLALIQTAMVEDALRVSHPELTIQRVIIKTSGDWKPEDGEKRLSEIEGGKGLFVREIEKALMEGAIDCAVHSTKDMPSFLPEGLALEHMLPRANPFDAFICRKYSSFMNLPQGAVVGTTSMRRQAFLLARRPDLKVVPLRGNVQTRIAKLDEGQVDATFLAMAGLQRLNLAGESFVHPLGADDMLPACGQGTISVETRDNDLPTHDLLSCLHHPETGLCTFVERLSLQILDGSCHTPIGAYARYEDGKMQFDLEVASPDGAQLYSESARQIVNDRAEAEEFGRAVASRLKARIPADIFQ